ncbi:hypothetical protein [uncultured Caulobacter sp.]|uniref:arsenate reductase/protein-tyrosine-phosphatase family protein n=1 Tax=uncultured Caulobacter sp. TaxID=158749 RepID=UPI002619336E|nr:hypothetical protein [uncultured Caulobacter sp.]
MRHVAGFLVDQSSVRLLSRRGLLALCLMSAPGAALATCLPTKVLFVCPAGTVKSAIAREALKRRAKRAALAVEVRSRGLDIEDHVSSELARRLALDDLDPKAEPALPFSPADVAWADLVIAFDEAASAPGLSMARAWRTPSWNSDYDRAKADLDQRLDALLAELAQSRCPSNQTPIR